MKQMIEWHSVDDMLPERKGLMDDETEYVLVAVNGCTYTDVTICGYDKDGFSEWDSFGRADPTEITHWAYLPEPPAKEVLK